MTVIKCPECGKEKISDTASKCPECGCDIKKTERPVQIIKRKKIYKRMYYLSFIIMFLGIYLFIYSLNHRSADYAGIQIFGGVFFFALGGYIWYKSIQFDEENKHEFERFQKENKEEMKILSEKDKKHY